MLRRAVLVAVLAGALMPASAHAAVQLVKAGSFSKPVYLTAPPGDDHRQFVVEQEGRIQLLVDGQEQATPFLDIHDQVGYDGQERGLLSMAFAPDYAASGKFYVDYVDTSGNLRVDELHRDPSNPNIAAGGQRNLLTIPHPGDANHNGGQLQFGPDGYLYISTGDGGAGDDTHHNAQFADNSHLLGKILRIDPFHGSPYTNPAGNVAGTPIYAYGLRNPWRFSFDRATGDMIIGDVGQNQWEEIDYAHAGQGARVNYGWPCYEATHLNTDGSVQSYPECNPTPAGLVMPVHEYGHSSGDFTGAGIIGGFVSRDPTDPDLAGRYVYGDLSTPGLRSIQLAQPAATDDQPLGVDVPSLSSFGEDAAGCLYAVSLDGDVYRLAPTTDPTPGPCRIAAPPPPPVDKTAPTLSVSMSRRQHVLRNRGIKLSLRGNEQSRVTGTATVNVGHTAQVLRFQRVARTLSPGKRVTLKLKLSKRTLARLRKAFRHRRSYVAKVIVSARDADRNATSKRRSVRLVR